MRLRRRRERGQALVEEGLLLTALLSAGAAGTVWLAKTNPDLLNALDVHVRGFYFLLSLPFP